MISSIPTSGSSIISRIASITSPRLWGGIFVAIPTAIPLLPFTSKLGNLVAIIDRNGLEADGPTDELTGLTDLAKKYEAFGWNVIEINGHKIKEIVNAFDCLPEPTADVPTVIIGKTVKGNGVSFMEQNVGWHAGKMTQEQYEQAKKEVLEKVEADNE